MEEPAGSCDCSTSKGCLSLKVSNGTGAARNHGDVFCTSLGGRQQGRDLKHQVRTLCHFKQINTRQSSLSLPHSCHHLPLVILWLQKSISERQTSTMTKMQAGSNGFFLPPRPGLGLKGSVLPTIKQPLNMCNISPSKLVP